MATSVLAGERINRGKIQVDLSNTYILCLPSLCGRKREASFFFGSDQDEPA